MRLERLKRLPPIALAATLGLAACSGSGTSPQGVTTANLPANVLQLAVGTANIYGGLPEAVRGLNVVTTYRQPAGGQAVGDSAVLVSSPTLSLPGLVPGIAGLFTDTTYHSTIATGPSVSEIPGHRMTSTAQNATNDTTFGISGGAFGLGLEPFNYSTVGTPGTADAVAPYAIPLYDNASADPNAFVPWGGPPAFDPNKDGEGVRDGNTYPTDNSGNPTLGISEGLDVFAGVAPAVGTYSLNVSVPANTGTVSQTATAAIKAATFLPAVAPSLPTLDGKGGGTFPIGLPAGVTEAYLQVTDIGPAQPTSTTAPPVLSCNGSIPAVDGSGGGPTYYTFVAKATGTFTLKDAVGPSGTPSLCTYAQNLATFNAATAGSATAPTGGDLFTLQVIGFDYPWYEASYPNSSGNPAPKIAGATGQSDITISGADEFEQPATAVPGSIVRVALTKRVPNARAVRRR